MYGAYDFALNGLLPKSKLKANDLHITVKLEGVKEVIWFNEEQIISNKNIQQVISSVFQ